MEAPVFEKEHLTPMGNNSAQQPIDTCRTQECFIRKLREIELQASDGTKKLNLFTY